MGKRLGGQEVGEGGWLEEGLGREGVRGGEGGGGLNTQWNTDFRHFTNSHGKIFENLEKA